MFARNFAATALLFYLIAPSIAQAQDSEIARPPNLIFFAHGGGNSSFDKTQVDVLWTGGLSYRLSY